jgi:hypothetical protein
MRLLLISMALSIAVAERACYYPDGGNATGLIPCDPHAKVTHCCRESEICLTNGLCFAASGTSLVRRGCTDSTWGSSNCSTACIGGMRPKSPFYFRSHVLMVFVTERFRSADAMLTPCGHHSDTYCCSQGTPLHSCCNLYPLGGQRRLDSHPFLAERWTWPKN